MSDYKALVELTDGLSILLHFSEKADESPEVSAEVGGEYLYVYGAEGVPQAAAATLREMGWDGPDGQGAWKFYV